MGKSKFLQDFKAFAMRGNVIDMAVGVIIGGAFGKIISSVVADVIMPPLGLLVGGVNLKKRCWNGGIYCTLRQKTMSTLAGSLQPACMPMPAAALTRSDSVSDITSGFAVIIRYLFFVLTKNGRHVAETRRPALS